MPSAHGSDAHIKTRVIPIARDAPDLAVIARAAEVIKRGGLVAFPTETVYGLGANAMDPAAIDRIYAAKERDRDDPLIVHIADSADVGRVAGPLTRLESRLASALWPGPLTLVLSRGPGVAPTVSGGRDTVAVRVPSHPVAQALIRAAGVPIAAPSANRFMRTSATSAAHVLEDLAGRIEVVLDGGPADAGIESTVVRCERNRVIVLRPGAVTVDQIRAQLARGEAIERTQMTTATAPSPGMMSRHYAPRTPLTYVTGPRAAAWLRAELDASPGVRVGLLLFDEYAPQFEALGRPVVQRIGPSARLSVAARRLFAALRALDSIGVDRIYALQPPLEGLGVAIDDRLRRAAERVVDTAS